MPINNPQEFLFQWHLTERCNLKCMHCYQAGGKTAELSLAEIRDALAEITDMLTAWSESYNLEFMTSMNVTGGEPLLRNDLFEIIGMMSSYGHDIYLLTNGTLINERNAKALADTGVQGVQVSIEGPEEIHDSIRGTGSFAASCRGISALVDAGLNVTLNATLSEMNAEKFKEMIEISSSLGAQKIGFSRLVPSGRGLELADRLIPRRRVKEIYESIFASPKTGIEIVTGDPIASQMNSAGVDDCGSTATSGCAAGISGLTILPDGSVTPCRRLAIPVGNVREDSLREIWANSEILEQLRDRSKYKGKCGVCRRWAHCRGCRAIAYAHSLSRGKADLCADDPQCFLHN